MLDSDKSLGQVGVASTGECHLQPGSIYYRDTQPNTWILNRISGHIQTQIFLSISFVTHTEAVKNECLLKIEIWGHIK